MRVVLVQKDIGRMTPREDSVPTFVPEPVPVLVATPREWRELAYGEYLRRKWWNRP